MTSKIFEGYLTLNWKNKMMTVKKRKPTNLSPYEIPVRIKIKVSMPEYKEIIAKGEITMSERTAEEIVVEEI